MQNHRVVSRSEWVAARREHLAKEKDLTRLRDQLRRERRKLEQDLPHTMAWLRRHDAYEE